MSHVSVVFYQVENIRVGLRIPTKCGVFVIVKPQQLGGPSPVQTVASREKNNRRVRRTVTYYV